MKPQEISLIRKALGDPNRMPIVQLLTRGELCACHLMDYFQITQPTLSHHMKVLASCDLVSGRKEGKFMYYSLNCATMVQFREFIATLNCATAEPLKWPSCDDVSSKKSKNTTVRACGCTKKIPSKKAEASKKA